MPSLALSGSPGPLRTSHVLLAHLDNGMPVYIDPNGAADVAAVYLWMDVGSRDEAPGMEGAAHFVEHLVFKGTASHGVGDVARAVEGAGGDLNAWTGFDETVFHASGPSASAPGFVEVLAEMARTARMDPTELERERLVVVEEIRSRDDDPEMLANEALFELAFPEHPYGRPIIGFERTVKKMPRAELMAFYQTMYAPSNGCLAVAGPVDVGRVMATANAVLSGGPARPTRRPRPPIDLYAVGRTTTLRKPFSATRVEMGWRVPGHQSSRMPALDALAMVLGGGTSAPLDTRLRRDLGLCLGASASLQTEADGGVLAVSLDVQDGKLAPTMDAVREVYDRVRTGVAREELARAKAQILADRVYARESVDGRAHQMVFHDRRFGDVHAGRIYDAAVAGLDAEALAAEAAMLDLDRACVVVLEPRGRRSNKSIIQSASHPPVVPMASAPRERTVTLDNGARILLRPDPSELVAIRVVGIGGHIRSRPGTAGRMDFWSRMITRGTISCSATDFAGRVESLAAGMSAFVGRSSQGLRCDLLAEHAREGLLLLSEILVNPAFDYEEVESVRAELLEELAQADDEPAERLSEAVWAACFEGHPWSVRPSGTPTTIRRLSSTSLRGDHREWACGQNLVVVVSGDFDPDMAERVLRRQVGRLPAGRAIIPAPTRPWTESARVLRHAGWEQTHLAAVWPGIGVHHPDAPALELLSAALGSQGGRLFDEVREKRGLAYGVGCSVQDGIVPGLFGATMATDPKRAVEAERAMLECIARARVDLRDEEIERARQVLLGAIDGERQHVGSRASTLAFHVLYGMTAGGQDPVLWARERYVRASCDDVRRIAGTVLSGPAIIVRVDPKRSRGDG